MSAKGNKKGLVLVTVLWVVVVLMVIVAVLGRKSRLDMKICLARMEGLRCKWACRAGIEKAIAVLNEDKAESEVPTDSLIDLWNDNDEDFSEIELQGCRFTVQVIDEASKLNINTATREQLLGLPYMLEEIADAIIDWRDSDDVPSAGGVESGYYEGLEFGYMARNRPFRTIRELLLVKDVTEELLYGEDTNLNRQLDYNEMDGDASPPFDDGDTDLDEGWIAYLTCYPSDNAQTQTTQTQTTQTQPTQTQNNQTQNNQTQNNQTQPGQTQDNQTQNNQTQPGQTQPTQTQDSRTQPGQTQPTQSQPAQGQTTQTQPTQGQATQTQPTQGQTTQDGGQVSARVNINTAPDIVLIALLGGGNEAEQTAQAIIAYRESFDYGIENLSELVDEGVVAKNTFDQIEQYLTTRSDVFTIRCFATADRNGLNGARLLTEAVVDRSSSPCKILYWYQGASN